MSSDVAYACRRSAGERWRHGHSPDRPPCCCEDRCTCRHCHGGPPRGGPPHSRDRSPSWWHGGGHHSPHSHRSPHSPHSHHSHSPPPPPSHFFHPHRGGGRGGRGGCGGGPWGGHRGGPSATRRCPSCVPEQAEMGEADLLSRQTRCEEARVAEQLRRTALADSVGPRGGHPAYASNTAEMLRRVNNAPYHAAVDAEYDARRRALQAELDARREEIIAMQRAREELRMEAAFSESETGRSERRGGSPRRPRSCTDEANPPPTPSRDAEAPVKSAPLGRPPHSRGDRTPPPLRHHRHHGWGWERGPHGPWGHGWGGCPPPPPSPPRSCERRAPSPWQHSKRPPHGGPIEHHHHHHPPHWGFVPGRGGCEGRRPPSPWGWKSGPPPPPSPHRHCDCEDHRPPSCQPGDVPPPPPPPPPPPSPPHHPPPQHEGGKCPPPPSSKEGKCSPPPPPPPRGCSPHHSPHPSCNAATNACPSCGHPLMSARDIVSMIAAGKLDNPVACPACGFVGGTLRCPVVHRHRSPSPHGCHCDGGGRRGRPRRAQSCESWPRGRSTASSSSSAHLTNPKFGRKVFITDDLYRDRRAHYLAEWEARGTVRRMPPSHRSPSAPLPQRTPKWRTTGKGHCSD